MSDTSPYGVHQHAAEGAVRQHTLVGTPIDHPTVNQVAGASPATFSTAPYMPKKQSPTCAKPGCLALHKKGSEWCRHHEPAATP